MHLNGWFSLATIQLIPGYIVLKFSFRTTINMKQLSVLIFAVAILFCLSSCSKEHEKANSSAKLVFVFKFDSTQQRLNNIGLPDAIPAGNSGQSPLFNTMSSHYVELAPNAFTALGSGDVLYRAPEVTTGGSNAIDFSQSVLAKEGETFLSVPLDEITPGTYQYLRVSLAYQNYGIKFNVLGQNLTGTVASFIGFNTYISNYKIKDSTVTVNANKLQGYWGLETAYGVVSGDAATTTVPNPIASTSPIPAGSCVVTGAFTTPLTITGKETKDIKITVSLSTNKSFEWKDDNLNGIFEPADGDSVVNMGIRGLIPSAQ
jgi:hypothetical protein